MKKIHYFIILFILLSSLIFFFWPKRTEEKTIFTPTQKKTVDVITAPLPFITDRKSQTEEIIYTDAGFSPAVLSIFSGDTIIFKNKSTKSFQPKSDKNFGAETSIAKNKEYQFTFQTPGEYGYYDQLDEAKFGAVVVQ